MRPGSCTRGVILNAYSFRYGRPCAAVQLPPIPLDAFHLCIYTQRRRLEVAYTGLSLGFGAWGSSEFKFGRYRPRRKYVTIRLARLRADHFLGGNVKDAGTQDSDHSENYGGGRDAVLPSYLYFPFCSRDYSELWTGERDFLSFRTAVNVIQWVCLGIDPTSSSGVSRRQLSLCAIHPHGTSRHRDQWQSRVSLTSNMWFLIQATDDRSQVSSCDDLTDHALVEESRG